MPQRLSAQSTTARREHRSRSSAPVAPAAKIGGTPEVSPEVAGVLKLQRTLGNRAVVSAVGSGDLWRMAVAQRQPAGASAGASKRGQGSSEDAGDVVNTIVDGLGQAIEPHRAKMRHLPDQQADMWIGIIDAYARMHPKRADVIPLFHDAENLYELLAPWGFVGRTFRYDPDREVAVPAQAVENLRQSIAVWKGEDARTRKKRRAQTHSTLGMYDRDRSATEVYYDDQQHLAGPNRADPSEPWGPDYEGSRAARRSERERLKNEHALGMIEGIATQGPGGLVGMVAGRLAGLLPGVDAQKSTELGMAIGGLADPFIMAGAEMAPAGGGSGGGAGNHDEIGEMAGPRQPMETPDLPGAKPTEASAGGGARKPGGGGTTEHGMGAPGPAGEGAAPRAQSGDTFKGMGASGGGTAGRAAGGGGGTAPIRAGDISEIKPDDVKALHVVDPNLVRHSASDSWHQIQWNQALQESGQWNPHDGPAPKAPMAFRYKGGMIQVNDLQWVKEGRPIAEIVRQSQLATGETAGGGSGGGAGGAKAGAGAGSSTQVGHAPGPAEAGDAGGASKGARAGDTQVGHAPGPGGVPATFKVPSGPPPRPPGNTVKQATHADVKELFKVHPELVVVGGDSLEFHQYIWEYKNWADGKRVTSDAPSAFHMDNGVIRVHAELWEREGGNISDILAPNSPARSEPTAFEAAKTLPAAGGGGGVGATNVSIAPGSGKR